MPNSSTIHPLESSEKMEMVSREGQEVGLMDAGFPGYLTEEEMTIYEEFRAEVYSRDSDFQETVFSFRAAQEEERFALCRWLRARKYNLSDTIQMIEEATILQSIPKSHNFFPSASDALKAEQHAYLKAYPQLYYGHAKNNCPIFISKPGVLNHHFLDCLTTRDGLINYHWHDQTHGFVNKLKEQHLSSRGQFQRYECVCILDLKGLTSSQLSKRCLDIIKAQTEIDSLCFPETLNKMFIVNAPSFFTMTWKILRGWIDARTANKVCLIGTNQAKILKKLLTVVDIHQIPADYGGKADSVETQMDKNMMELAQKAQPLVTGMETYLMPVRSTASHQLIVKKNHEMELSIMTRSMYGGYITIFNSTDNTMVPGIPDEGLFILNDVERFDENEPSERMDLADHNITLKGGCTYDFKIKSNGGSFSTDYFLLLTTESIIAPIHKDEGLTTKSVISPPIKDEDDYLRENRAPSPSTTNSTASITSTSTRSIPTTLQPMPSLKRRVQTNKTAYPSSSTGSSGGGGVLISAKSLGVGTLPKRNSGFEFTPSPSRKTIDDEQERQSLNSTTNPSTNTIPAVNQQRTNQEDEAEEGVGVGGVVPSVKRLAQAQSFSSDHDSKVSQSTTPTNKSELKASPPSPKYVSTFSCGIFSCY